MPKSELTDYQLKYPVPVLTLGRDTLWLIVGAVSVLLMGLAFLLVEDKVAVLFSIIALLLASIIFWLRLIKQDRQLPIYDLGSFCMLATVAYSVQPLVWYVLSDFQFSVLSHRRLQALDPGPREFSTIAWFYVLHMLVFSWAYLRFRKPLIPNMVSRPLVLDGASIYTIVILAISFKLLFVLLNVLYGVNFKATYDSSIYVAYEAYMSLPLLARQLIHHFFGISVVFDIAVSLLFVILWKRKGLWRFWLIVWVVWTIVDYLLYPSGRFELFALMLAVLVSYHRFVRPVRFGRFLIVGGLLFFGFMVLGLVRGGESILMQAAAVSSMLESSSEAFTIANEFQISYASTLEVRRFVESGLIREVPWQVSFYEILAIFPQQILPFEKIDRIEWYLEATDNRDFFTYGVISQTLLGLGWVELTVRGVVLGLICAYVHNWCTSKSSGFWKNVFYIWLMIVCYQVVRNGTLYLLPLIVYRFIPLMIMFFFLKSLLKMGANRGFTDLNTRVSQC